MSRLRITPWENAQRTVDDLYADMERRISAAPCGNCPVELTSAFLKLCLAQSCGKCVPCRIGLDRLADLLDRLLDGQGSQEDLETILRTAHTIVDSADCAIGFEAAQMVLDGYVAFQDDYLAHVTQGSCTANFKSVPCVELCPAHVDAPGYISLVGEGRYADAIRLIRKDNPFPSVCALVCEHPCESHCRRTIVDSPLNIRGIKRFAVDNAGEVPVPPRAPETGKKIAVIGGTGSGKSTLVQLLLSFRLPTEGQILFDGVSASQIDRGVIRKNISCVLQKTAVYSGTIRHNIEMGRPGAEEADILEAADIAQLTPFLNSLPEHLEHPLQQSGKNLSGGQKQRLCIARAILKDAPIYVFDDSFSALDFLTEANLRRSLNEKIQGKTQIVITQRITSAMNADHIFVMDRGRLVDHGVHAELLSRCKIYQEIYASQTGGDAK